MAEPAEEDVMRLAAVLGGGKQGVYHQRIYDARRALAAGVTLPPEPDTPAEAEERYTAEPGNSSTPVWSVRDGRVVAELPDATGRTDTATEPLFTGTITTRGERQHVPGKPDVVIGIPGPKQDKLNLFARVGEQVDVYRLGQRPAAPAQAVTAEMVLATVVKSPWIEAKRPMDWTVEEVRQVVNGLNAQIDALNRLLAERLPAAVPQDDDPAEPLFTGKVQGRRSLMGMKHLDWVQIAPAYREDFPFDRLDIDDLVDVYPHGQRPAEGDGR